MTDTRDDIRQRGKLQAKDAPDLQAGDDDNDKARRKTKTGPCGLVCKVIIAGIVILAVFLYVTPSPIQPVSFSLPAPPVFEGALTPNNKLQKAEKMFENEIIGPESLEQSKGGIYTGLADGRIVNVAGNKVTEIARLGVPPCGGVENEHTCGRPLGMRFHKDGNLYVMDAYKGIFSVDVQTGDFVQLISSDKPINGRPMRFLNDLDVASDNMIYFTDSSDKFERRQNRLLAMESSATARVFRLNPFTDQIDVLMDGLAFANGIQLSPDEGYLLVCESLRMRIHRYYLRGPKQGTSDIFADNVPGVPDNIRPRIKGGYWVGISVIRKQPFSAYDFMATRPWIRNILAKLFHQNFINKFLPKYGLAIALDENGKITQSLQDPTGETINGVSEVLDVGSHLYLGSYNAPFLAKLNFQDTYP